MIYCKVKTIHSLWFLGKKEVLIVIWTLFTPVPPIVMQEVSYPNSELRFFVKNTTLSLTSSSETLLDHTVNDSEIEIENYVV